ncbi:hypothetical protein CAI16_06850 [Virgibacillus dokdonensis]|uniref:Uncharacterized protein n=2 Tax=Virgibacillus TaxID=84406 RepID=A0A1M5WB90_9BACI|nr:MULTISPECIES: hypothetical protein [Virgibacillus]RFA35939.1 hypothetical protein CAI16_06850 [Virgibacillus dokdonensis]SHH84859.1 hypothetical protein SAMN05421807_115105 [Virgibacillus chiguensis]
MKKITKTQVVTILLIIGWMVWEYYVWQWSKTEVGAVIRVDLIFIVPIILIMVIISILQLLKSRK